MDNKQKSLVKLAVGIGGLAVVYYVINYLAHRKDQKTPVSLERTKKLLQQIKYQMYSNCISFSEGVNLKLKTKYPEKDLQVYLRTELTKLYQIKEELILSKFAVSTDEYGESLKAHAKDKDITKNLNQIFDMMQRAVRGQGPDLTVPQAALRLHSPEQVKKIYQQVCQEVAVKVQEKLIEKMQINPSFNPKNDTHFKKAIRQISIYDFKVQFLQKKGYRKEWGCPNEVFYKVMETQKQDIPEIKIACYRIEKGYEKLIEKVSQNPEEMPRQKILQIMEQQVNFQPSSQPKPSGPAPTKAALSSSLKPNQPFFGSIKPQVPVRAAPKVAIQEDDMETLMMKQLMSRSMESPKASKKVPVVQNLSFGSAKIEEKPENVPQKIEEQAKQINVQGKVSQVDQPKVQDNVQPKSEEKVQQQTQNQIQEPVEQQKLEKTQAVQEKIQQKAQELIKQQVQQSIQEPVDQKVEEKVQQPAQEKVESSVEGVPSSEKTQQPILLQQSKQQNTAAQEQPLESKPAEQPQDKAAQ